MLSHEILDKVQSTLEKNKNPYEKIQNPYETPHKIFKPVKNLEISRKGEPIPFFSKVLNFSQNTQSYKTLSVLDDRKFWSL